MTSKAFILISFFIGLAPALGYAQSAQAVMHVSVRVVSGNSVQVEQPKLISLARDSEAVLGKLRLSGADAGSTLINVEGQVVLEGTNGQKIKLNISHWQNRQDNSSSVKLKGFSDKKMITGLYRGQLTTTIEYY